MNPVQFNGKDFTFGVRWLDTNEMPEDKASDQYFTDLNTLGEVALQEIFTLTGQLPQVGDAFCIEDGPAWGWWQLKDRRFLNLEAQCHLIYGVMWIAEY